MPRIHERGLFKASTWRILPMFWKNYRLNVALVDAAFSKKGFSWLGFKGSSLVFRAGRVQQLGLCYHAFISVCSMGRNCPLNHTTVPEKWDRGKPFFSGPCSTEAADYHAGSQPGHRLPCPSHMAEWARRERGCHRQKGLRPRSKGSAT